jgi:putative FmdB family regulatory protein
MPLFTYKCDGCKKLYEKFIKSDESVDDCECGSKLSKVFVANVGGRIWKGSKDNLENVIKPAVDKIHEKLAGNSDSTFLDICGDS